MFAGSSSSSAQRPPQGTAPLLLLLLVPICAVALGIGITQLTDTQAFAVIGIIAAVSTVLFVTGRRVVDGTSLTFMERAIVGIVVIASFTATWNGVRVYDFFTLSDVALIASLFLVGPILVGQRTTTPVPVWLTIPAFVFLLIGFGGVAFAGYSGAGLVHTIRLVAAMTLAPLLIGFVGGRLRVTPLLVDAWIGSMVVSGLIATSDYMLGTDFGTSITSVVASSRSTGLATHSNHLAVTAVLTVPLCVARLSTARSVSARLLYAAATTVVMLAILTSGSRGGLVAGITGILLTPLFMPSALRARTTWRSAAVIAAAAVLAISFAPNNSFVAVQRTLDSLTLSSTSSSSAASAAESDRIRGDRRQVAVDEFNQSPLFGVGLDRSRSAHNIYLQLLASTGVIGLVAFLFYLGGLLQLGLRLRSHPLLPGTLRAIAAAAGVTALLFALLGLVENQIADRYLYFPCGFVLAVHLALRTGTDKHENELIS